MKYKELACDATSYPYIVWAGMNSWDRAKYNLYKINEEKTWWLSQSNTGSGFDIETVKRWCNSFEFFNTEEDARLYIREQEYGEEATEGDEDFCCPSCKRRFYGKELVNESDENKYTIKCFCGEKLYVKPEVTIRYCVTVEESNNE